MSLLPPNSTPLERTLERATAPALDPEVIRTLWNPATCPAHLLPWLAWALSVDEWDDSWDEATQRRVIAASIVIHRRKGTVGAVRAALASLGHASTLIEWWQLQPRGVPHTFIAEVQIDNRGMDDALLAALERQINRAKPERSHHMLRLIARSTAQLHVGCAVLSGETVEIRPWQMTRLDVQPAALHAGIGGQHWATVTLYPMT